MTLRRSWPSTADGSRCGFSPRLHPFQVSLSPLSPMQARSNLDALFRTRAGRRTLPRLLQPHIPPCHLQTLPFVWRGATGPFRPPKRRSPSRRHLPLRRTGGRSRPQERAATPRRAPPSLRSLTRLLCRTFASSGSSGPRGAVRGGSGGGGLDRRATRGARVLDVLLASASIQPPPVPLPCSPQPCRQPGQARHGRCFHRRRGSRRVTARRLRARGG